MIKAVFCIVKKDLFILSRSSGGFLSGLLLGVLLIFLFSLSQGIAENISAKSASCIFWIASLFNLVLIFNALYAIEEETLARKALLLCGRPAFIIWLAKSISGLLLVLVSELIFFLSIIIFLDKTIVNPSFLGFSAILLGSIGMVSLSSLLSAINQQQHTKDALLSIILFPLLIPLLMGAIELLASLFELPQPLFQINLFTWFKVVTLFDIVFITVGMFLFKFIWSE